MSQLSTAPAVEGAQAVPGSFGGSRKPGALGRLAWTGREVLGWCRWFWRQLTSMRVALILLLLLSLASIPGSLIPQNNVDVIKAKDFKARHEVLTPIYEKLQMFDVYTSVWFSAIYILLFVSLAGCIVPRTWQFVGQLRARPPRAPRRLNGMPAYTTWRTDAEPEEVLGAARTMLARKRFRVHAQGDAVASEKGYLREAGNLMFHIALIVLLLAFAAGELWKSEGGKLVVQGDGFSNTLTQYDDFKSGSLFGAKDLDSFGFRLNDFTAEYKKEGPDAMTPSLYKADISYWEGVDGKEKKSDITMNHPLEVGDSKVYLLAHGFAPVVTMTDGEGKLAYRGPVAFIPQDTNLTSSGVIKVPDYKNAKGHKEQLGFQGFFVPHFGGSDAETMFSQSPELENPVLFLTAYRGDLGIDSGLAQSVYQLDTKNMKQFKTEDGGPLAQKMLPGDSMKLPDGAGTLKFEGIKQWANFQISHQVGGSWALGGSLAAIAGLAGSLFIQRRRVWVRAVTGADGRTVVEMAGLGRSESARLPVELGDLAHELRADAPLATEPDADAAADDAAADETPDEDTAPDQDAAPGDDVAPDENEKADDTAEPAPTGTGTGTDDEDTSRGERQ
ncbi:cytochrome c biogenesis protein ResB [Streptomyces sp. N2-109]|uniref:Cytochrome c biogenesis protein ResB n=1 Tax=Streptomyces gossypii TaxID=2883101 RepID=A0ABT2JW06_9ACTN|nr:cytochrome c biogenesis protein ResB [Streptomyces gossypii]MCT2592094.1 cytochrome c biogenesis protein ResB [Streptomyces gossypii]